MLLCVFNSNLGRLCTAKFIELTFKDLFYFLKFLTVQKSTISIKHFY
jgi:hypothetical protein